MKQKKICRFFGEPAQILKAHEELDEIQEAFEDYLNNQNQETLKHVLNELGDLSNVLEGIYSANGGCLEEIAADKEIKLNRTISIMKSIPDRCVCKIQEYDRLRGK